MESKLAAPDDRIDMDALRKHILKWMDKNFGKGVNSAQAAIVNAVLAQICAELSIFFEADKEEFLQMMGAYYDNIYSRMNAEERPNENNNYLG